jgi:GT2 family glycosyltransferase
MKVLIVIVNYRSAELCADCLDSLDGEFRSFSPADIAAVITDNASRDGSGGRLAEIAQSGGRGAWCRFVQLGRNGGFAYGNNAALPPVGELPPYVLLLNPDTVVRRGAIGKLVDFMERNPRAGIVGSRLEDPDGTAQVSAFNFPTVLSELEGSARLGVVTRLLRRFMIAPPVRDGAHRCDWVAGACMLIRREVFRDVGLLDEKYFMYYEEVDFCLRAARAGWECWYEPAARVVHLVGQSSGVTDTKKPPRRLPGYWFESRQRYFRKNHGSAYAVAADFAWFVGRCIHVVARTLRGRPNVDPPFMVRDFLVRAFHRKAA